MNAEPPQRTDRQSRYRRQARLALWLAGVGGGGGLAIVIAAALGEISVMQTIMLGVPVAVLILGGLMVALARDPESAERLGFRAGLSAGSLRNRWRSVFGRQREDRP